MLNPSHLKPNEKRILASSITSCEVSAVQPGLLRTFAEWMAAVDPWKHFRYSATDCLSKLQKPAGRILVAQDNLRPLGFLAYNDEGPFGGPLINYICTDPALQAKGIGTQLLLDLFEKFPGKSFYLTVSQSNERAKALYERLGFLLIGTIPDYNFSGECEFIMRRPGPPKREALR